jgi:hypothetical protein
LAYTITKTSGSVLTTVADGTIDNTTDLTLVGKNYSGYGQILNENFVALLENFSNSSQPSQPLSGQLWWDSTNKLLKVYTGTGFKVISSSTAASSAPSNAAAGDLWFDTTNTQLRVYNGSTWILVGPSFTAGTGTTGAIVDTITDNLSTNHVVVKFFVNESLVGIVSKDAAFTPQSTIAGFSTVAPGIQLSSAVTNAAFTGNASNTLSLNGLASSQFMRADANTSTTGTLSCLNNSGFTVGAANNFKIAISGSDTSLTNQTSNGNVNIAVNKSVGGVTNAIIINGSTGVASLAATPTALDNSTKIATTAYVDSNTLYANGSKTITGNILPDADGTRNLGSSSYRFSHVYADTLDGTALTAQYADLAERFESDSSYDAGTVVMLGGAAEITAVNEELSDNVFGVVSERAAFTMNNAAGSNETHPPVALTGRVRVKVLGAVNKGDRLVASGTLGTARAAALNEATSFNVIGRALEDKIDSGLGTVLTVVTVH